MFNPNPFSQTKNCYKDPLQHKEYHCAFFAAPKYWSVSFKNAPWW